MQRMYKWFTILRKNINEVNIKFRSSEKNREKLYLSKYNKLFNRLNWRIKKQKRFFKPYRKIRNLRYGLILVNHAKRNTFVTIMVKSVKTGENIIVFKSSVGLIGYSGPKKGTVQGKIEVAKSASYFLSKTKFHMLDLIFQKRMPRWAPIMLRRLLRNSGFIRSIVIKKRQSHGFTRLRKKRRT